MEQKGAGVTRIGLNVGVIRVIHGGLMQDVACRDHRQRRCKRVGLRLTRLAAQEVLLPHPRRVWQEPVGITRNGKLEGAP